MRVKLRCYLTFSVATNVLAALGCSHELGADGADSVRGASGREAPPSFSRVKIAEARTLPNTAIEAGANSLHAFFSFYSADTQGWSIMAFDHESVGQGREMVAPQLPLKPQTAFASAAKPGKFLLEGVLQKTTYV